MIINANIGMIFIDCNEEYMKTIKAMLECNKRLSAEIIHLVQDVEDGIAILQDREDVELIALHIEANKIAVYKALTQLRQTSRAEIMVISHFKADDDIAEIYRYGADIWLPSIYKPQVAVAHFESFYERRRLLPSMNSMKEVEHIRDEAKMRYGGLTIDPIGRIVQRDGGEITLSSTEFDLLLYLVRNTNRACSRGNIISAVWNTHEAYKKDLSCNISRLRAKIEPDPDHPIYSYSS